MIDFEQNTTVSYKVKAKGFERIFSNYDSAYTVFDRLVNSGKKKKQPFTVSLLSKEGFGGWAVVDKTTIKNDFFD
jgi:hypothetical protein